MDFLASKTDLRVGGGIMAMTHFGQGCVWMNLKDQDELNYLRDLIRLLEFKIKKIETLDSSIPDKPIHVIVHRVPDGNKYLYGEEYRKWEKIKSKMYIRRRDISDTKRA